MIKQFKLRVILMGMLLTNNAHAKPVDPPSCGTYTLRSPLADPFYTDSDSVKIYERFCGQCLLVNYTQFKKVSCHGKSQFAVVGESINSYKEITDEKGNCVAALVQSRSRQNDVIVNCQEVCVDPARTVPFFFELRISEEVNDYELCSTAASGSNLIKTTTYKPDSITTYGGCGIPWAISGGGFDEKVYNPVCEPKDDGDKNDPPTPPSSSPAPSSTSTPGATFNLANSPKRVSTPAIVSTYYPTSAAR